MDLIDHALVRFGLTASEAKVYRSALSLAETSPFELSRITGIPRTTVYEIVGDLALKGLLTIKKSDGFSKQQTKITAKNPSILREVIAGRREELAETELDIVDILPNLKSGFAGGENHTDFRFYPGIIGAREVMEMGMNSEMTYSWNCMLPMDAFGREYTNKIVDLENKNSKYSNTKYLIPLNKWTKHALSYQTQRNKGYLKNHQFRYIDSPGFNIHQEIYLKGQRIYIICADGDETWGMVIKSKSLTSTFGSMFLWMWEKATPITMNLIQSWGPNEFLEAEKRKK